MKFRSLNLRFQIKCSVQENFRNAFEPIFPTMQKKWTLKKLVSKTVFLNVFSKLRAVIPMAPANVFHSTCLLLSLEDKIQRVILDWTDMDGFLTVDRLVMCWAHPGHKGLSLVPSTWPHRDLSGLGNHPLWPLCGWQSVGDWLAVTTTISQNFRSVHGLRKGKVPDTLVRAPLWCCGTSADQGDWG